MIKIPWPLKGGTWQERLIAGAFFLELMAGLAAIYGAAWILAPYF